jgi:UDP-glucose 4-epimerase
MSYVLLTGGAGYIGSHTALALLNAGEKVISFDNYHNSSSESLKRVQQLSGRSLIDIQGDILDSQALAQVFEQYPIKAVIHFAGLKAVGESTAKPLWYYENNVAGTVNLCKLMSKHGVKSWCSALQPQSMALQSRCPFMNLHLALPPILMVRVS